MFGDMGKLLKLKAKFQQLQEELGKKEVQGVAGNGAVTVTMNGRAEVLRVQIDPRVTADVGRLEDLVASACRDAHEQVKKILQSELGAAAGPLGGLLGM